MDLPSPQMALAGLTTLLAVAGMGQAVAGWRSVRRFAADPGLGVGEQPPVTLLKPLRGDEPLLEAALTSVCAQEYPAFQIVFGVQHPADAAIGVVRRLQERFPQVDIELVINPTQHGPNRKIGNLINMFPAAKHDLLVIADSDLHCAPDYISRVVAEFAAPGVGLVTTLYAGLAANRSIAGAFGATAINHGFLPGALMSRDLGRQDCLGATMALRRETLAAIGGLHALVDHLADDNVLGRLVRSLCLSIRLAATVPATTVPESNFQALWRHELRWSRTILSLVPVEFALSSIQFPLFWAACAWVISGATWASVLFAASWAIRAACVRGIDCNLGLVKQARATAGSAWLLPARDFLSIFTILASYMSDRVEWRGEMMHTRATELPESDATSDPIRTTAPQGTLTT